tara:strand:+ start:465 stop:1013 length:549 start_codon:yes stop_codon:yes gene_type:complete
LFGEKFDFCGLSLFMFLCSLVFYLALNRKLGVGFMINIRAVEFEDFENWLVVYQHYADHYKIELNDKGIKATWSWLLATDHPLKGIVAEQSNTLIGLAHYRAMPSPLRGKDIGFLDDLIVVPESRGGDAANMLLNELRLIAERECWGVMRWITKDDNYRARSLYDQLAQKTDWNMYEMSVKG